MASVTSSSKAFIFQQYPGPPKPKPRPVFRPSPIASQRSNISNSKAARDYMVMTGEDEHGEAVSTQPTSSRNNDEQRQAEASISSQVEVVIISSDDESESGSDAESEPQDAWPTIDELLNMRLEANNTTVDLSSKAAPSVSVDDGQDAATTISKPTGDDIREQEVMNPIISISDSSSSHSATKDANTILMNDAQPAVDNGITTPALDSRKRPRTLPTTSKNMDVDPKRHKDDTCSPSTPLSSELCTQNRAGQAFAIHSSNDRNPSHEDDSTISIAIEDVTNAAQSRHRSLPCRRPDSSTVITDDPDEHSTSTSTSGGSSDSEGYSKLTLCKGKAKQARSESSRRRKPHGRLKKKKLLYTRHSMDSRCSTGENSSPTISRPPVCAAGSIPDSEAWSAQHTNKAEFVSLQLCIPKITNLQLRVVSPGLSFFSAVIHVDGDMMDLSPRMLEKIIQDTLRNTARIEGISLSLLEATENPPWLLTGFFADPQGVITPSNQFQTALTPVCSDVDLRRRAEALSERDSDGRIEIPDSEDGSPYITDYDNYDRIPKSRGRLKRTNRAWESLEEHRVLAWKKEGLSWEEMEKKLDGRSKGAIYLRWHTKLRHDEDE